MEDRLRYVVGIGVTAALFVLIHLGGLALVTPLVGVDTAPPTDPADPSIGIVFVLALLVITGLMLAAFRWGFSWLVKAVVLLVAFGLSWFVLDVLVPAVLTIGGVPVIPPVLAGGLVALLAIYPEWYVLDVVGILVGAGAVGMLGLTLGIRAALLLLVVLAIYDLVSVYGTKHMITLAEGAMRGRLPVVLVIPLSLPFSMAEMDANDEEIGPEGALVIGLGDAVIPGMLATSAALHGPVEPAVIGGIAVSGPIVGVIAGTIVGLFALFAIAAKGAAHPGLPFLATGAIIGYFVGATLVGIGPTEALAAMAPVASSVSGL